MSTTTMQSAKQKIEKWLRKSFGKNYQMEYRPKGCTQKQRDAARAGWEIAERKSAELLEESKSIGPTTPALREAARFVVDVNGDHPSIDQLRTALEKHERGIAINEELAELKRAKNRLLSDCHSYRYQVSSISEVIHGFPLSTVLASGDSWEEVLEKLEVKMQ